MAVGGFRGIIGHADVVRHFRTAIAGGRVGHAYLITGEAGSGKRTVADAFARTLLCERVAEELAGGESEAAKSGGAGDLRPNIDPEQIDACLSCRSCKKAADRNHPDIIFVTHEKPNVISVGEIREQVVNTVDILPYESRYKVYIIPEAEKLNPQAQNALLKTIEEPPAYAVVLLLATSPEALLPTILSRCVHLSLRPVADREVSDYLTRELHMPDYEARMLTSFAQGNIGRAAYAATDEAFIGRRDRTLGLIRALHGMDTAAIAEAIRRMKEERSYIDDILDILLMWYRDVLLFKATAEVDQLIFGQSLSIIRAQASAASYEGLQEILAAIDRCRVRLRANVNFELALELMLITIKENCNA